MRIALVGIIGAKNLGDVIIYDNVKYLIDKWITENNYKDIELISIDISGVNPARSPNIIVRKLYKFTRVCYQKCIEKQLSKEKDLQKRRRLLIKAWHHTKTYKIFHKKEMQKFESVDLIIFVGGGIIKYRAQKCHYLLNEITLIADAKNIPVILNSVGVEGYDENDEECMLLKAAINRTCVRYISTRDDIVSLKRDYVTNSRIEIEQVCDPAFWSQETYRVTPSCSKKRIVGLNAIRPEIFEEYLYSVDIYSLQTMYYELIDKLLNTGYYVEIFTNGFGNDSKFISSLISRYPQLSRNKRVSVFKPKRSEQLVLRISEYERILAVRLHCSIIATTMGIPNVNLVWNVKQLHFGEIVGMKENYLCKEHFTADKVYAHLMSAQGYKMNQNYKNSVYSGLTGQISKIYKERAYNGRQK